MSRVYFRVFLLVWVTAGVCGQTCYDELHKCKTKAQTSDNDPCTNFVSWLNCTTYTKDYCQLEETNGVTFESVQKVAKNSCAEMASLLMGGSPCEELKTCVMQNTKFVELSQPNRNDFLNVTVKTEFWCSVILGPLNCAITKAKVCHFEDDRVTSITRQRDQVKEVCQGGAGTFQEGTLTTVLVLSAAALLIQLIFP